MQGGFTTPTGTCVRINLFANVARPGACDARLHLYAVNLRKRERPPEKLSDPDFNGFYCVFADISITGRSPFSKAITNKEVVEPQ